MPPIEQLAVFAYQAYRPSGENRLFMEGWELDNALSRADRGNGFDGSVFVRGEPTAPTEIVISFRGTDGITITPPDPGVLDWAFANLPAAFGLDWGQVYQAIELVADTMAKYPEVNITFTGHSLGGGLASLMAVFFGRPAHTFDTELQRVAVVTQRFLLRSSRKCANFRGTSLLSQDVAVAGAGIGWGASP